MASRGGIGYQPKAVRRYLLTGEHCVIGVRRHWVVIAEPWLSTVASLLLVSWLTFEVLAPRVGRPADVLWWVWFVVLGRAVWLTIDHRMTWFVATDRRLLLVHGVFLRKVAMMPLRKVTDMTYERSPLGYVLGYGTFVMESAGQDQALREIDHVPHPDENYRVLVQQIFHKAGDPMGEEGSIEGAPELLSGDAVEWEDDPTSRLALPEDRARLPWLNRAGGSWWSRGTQWAADRFRGERREYPPRTGSAGPGEGGTASTVPGGVGARHEARDGWREHDLFARDDGGESIYRSGSPERRDR